MRRQIIFLLLSIGLIILAIFFYGVYSLRERIKKDMGFNDDFFKRIALIYYDESYEGIVSKKYIDSTQHNFKKVILTNRLNQEEELRLDYEWPRLYYFIQVGDSISKKKKSLDMRLRRAELDTMIRLNFSNIKNSEDYIDFLYELDSIREW